MPATTATVLVIARFVNLDELAFEFLARVARASSICALPKKDVSFGRIIAVDAEMCTFSRGEITGFADVYRFSAAPFSY